MALCIILLESTAAYFWGSVWNHGLPKQTPGIQGCENVCQSGSNLLLLLSCYSYVLFLHSTPNQGQGRQARALQFQVFEEISFMEIMLQEKDINFRKSELPIQYLTNRYISNKDGFRLWPQAKQLKVHYGEQGDLKYSVLAYIDNICDTT